ncbi:LytTR family transcriptional regulator [Stakelama sp. CBK3Z-3]|uniref:LytTR family transcriptional regulator n=1 Tax=Stakelama flava TaxID=2860338 RepID=A0ABS6XNZ0_9SPHN|nr:LytTR family DNA-binding domain-containing protein [Stakelama flava]MBW4331938.1 LytTR family transcriptional regulator [Stakelama flava]
MPMRLLIILLLACLAAPAAAQPFSVDAAQLRLCADARAETPAAIDQETCRATRIESIDPQGRALWITGSIVLPREARSGPIGLYLSGKMASSVWWNGRKLGDNGKPGVSATTERAGQMDAVFFVPPSVVHAGKNRIAIRMSGMHGFLHLDRPVHWIGVAPYEPPRHLALAGYWPALVTFGAFVAAALYFGAMTLRGRDKGGSVLLTAMAVFAAGQLLAEVSRGLFGYAYPLHDVRLIVILACSLGFGGALFAYLWRRFDGARPRIAVAVTIAATLAIAIITPGYDGKTAMAVLVPVAAGIVALTRWTLQRRPGAAAHLAALAIFATLIVLGPLAFLDRYFYFAVAALLGFLFVRQALALVAEEDLRISQTARAERLEAALAQACQRTEPTRIPVIATGRADFVPAESIVHCRAAGDYVELVLDGGATLLHGGTLNQLERSLPATFLRVHRSHIVHSGRVSSLTRDATGTGMLALENGDSVPVSRRVMPRVRSALTR